MKITLTKVREKLVYSGDYKCKSCVYSFKAREDMDIDMMLHIILRFFQKHSIKNLEMTKDGSGTYWIELSFLSEFYCQTNSDYSLMEDEYVFYVMFTNESGELFSDYQHGRQLHYHEDVVYLTVNPNEKRAYRFQNGKMTMVQTFYQKVEVSPIPLEITVTEDKLIFSNTEYTYQKYRGWINGKENTIYEIILKADEGGDV